MKNLKWVYRIIRTRSVFTSLSHCA